MKKQYRPEIKNIADYNDVATDILDCYIESFQEVDGLTRPVTDEDIENFGEDVVGFMYTQAGMKLYERACDRLFRLGLNLFPGSEKELNIEARGMLFP